MSSTPFLLSDSLKGASFRWPAIFQAWLPAFLLAALVAVESTSIFGSNRTSAPLHSLLHALLGASIDPHWDMLHHLLRKAGHFAGYGILSLALYRGFRLTLFNIFGFNGKRISHTLAIAATFLVAGADEIHQAFLPNRTGCFRDVLLDTAGAVALQLALSFTLRAMAQLKAGLTRERKLKVSRAVSLAA